MFFFFFFNDTATTEIYTLSLHDALPISSSRRPSAPSGGIPALSDTSAPAACSASPIPRDRKSTRLNSSHGYISYAVFCLKKKKKEMKQLNSQYDLVVDCCMYATQHSVPS